MESLKSYIFLLACLSFGIGLQAQPTYILFDQACMERLTFDQNRPDAREDYVVYHVNLRSGEKLILEVGEESNNEQNYVPETYLSCSSGGIDKTLMTRINSNRSQVFIVYPKNNRKYTISAVATAAFYGKQGSLITYESPKYQFRFDLDYGTIGENIAYDNPGVKLYFEGKLTNDCTGSFLFRQLAPTSAYPLVDLVLMPEIGIVEERAGANASAAMSNALILKEVNGLSKDRYMREICGAEPGSRGTLTARQVTATPTSYNTTPSYNPPVAGNLPPGAILPGGQAVSTITPPTAPMTNVATTNTSVPNQVNTTTTTPLTTAKTPATTTHTVASGETLYGISRKYSVSVADIKTWNNLKSNTIRRGQVLTVAPPSTAAQQAAPEVSSSLAARTGTSTTLTGTPVPYAAGTSRIATGEENEIHVVQAGETVASIALTYGYTAKRFREINDLGPTDYVKVGQRLKTTDCDCPTVAQPTTTSSTFAPTTTTATTPTVPTPNSYGSTGGRISPNTFTARTPTTNSYMPPVVSPGSTQTPIQNAGGYNPSTPNTPAANVYNTILPTGYDSPVAADIPSSYNAPPTTTARGTTTMSGLENRSSMIASGNNSGFGETAVVPASARPQEYTFTPSSPYPVPTSGNTNNYNSTYQPPSPATSTPSSYYTPPSALPNSYDMNTMTARRPDSYYQGVNNQRRVHIVQDGESLYGISRQYSISVEQLRRLNQLNAGDVITPDQTLYVE